MEEVLTHEEQKALFILMGRYSPGIFLPDENALKKAFRSKVKKSHPDLAVSLGKDPMLLQMKFQELHEAFTLLSERIHNDEPGGCVKPAPSPHDNKSKGQRYKTSRTKGFKSRDKATFRTKDSKTKPSAYRNQKVRKESSFNQNSDLYYQGRTPLRYLRFAEYLYYTGDISWDDLVQALVWQYRNRPKLGKLAEVSGILSFDDIMDIIRAKKNGEMFGDAAVRLRYFNAELLTTLILQQKKLNLPIGKYFMSSHIMTPSTLVKKLTENHLHNYNFKK